MKADSLVITGLGAVTPYGLGSENLWSGVTEGRDVLRRIERFEAGRYLSKVAGTCDLRVGDHISDRKAKRMDRFSHLGLVASREAISQSGIDIGSDVDPERVGVFVGNVLGGWEFAERELRHLWVQGVRNVSPYQATAWFPTALQGQMCMEFGVKGMSRTLIADRASSAHAFIQAAMAIQRGDIDVAVVGGSEAPLSPYGWLCVQASQTAARTGEDTDGKAYRPFQQGHSGTLYAEGAAFVVLETAAHAFARGACPMAELAGWARTSDAYMPHFTVEPTGRHYAAAIRTALSRAGVGSDRIAAIFAAGSGIPFEDVTEGYAISAVFGEKIPVTAPKSFFGSLLGASAAADVVLATLSMTKGLMPATRDARELAVDVGISLLRECAPMDGGLGTCVLSRGLGGCNAALVLLPIEQDWS